jgi:hypothetical protein
MNLAIDTYEPTPDEIEAEGKTVDLTTGPLLELLKTRIRYGMLKTAYSSLIDDYKQVMAAERQFDKNMERPPS